MMPSNLKENRKRIRKQIAKEAEKGEKGVRNLFLQDMMNSADVSRIVATALAQWRYDPPAPGTTIGVPWSEEKMLKHIEELKSCLVTPYLQRFVLRETYDQIQEGGEVFAEYWVVAEDHDCLEWYDPNTNEFGLGERRTSSIPVSIGVRGDFVGVYCAI